MSLKTLMKTTWKTLKEGLYVRTEFVKVKDIPYSIGHISDLHFDDTGKLPQWVQDSVIDIIHEHHLEVLCVTGDILDGETDKVHEALSFLHSIPVNYVVVSLGNHDEKYIDEFIMYMANSPYKPKIQLGINTRFVYKGVNFVSMADINSKYYRLQSLKLSLDENKPNIVLAHHPHSFWDVIKCKGFPIPLVMSGHTHGGQILRADCVRSLFSKFMNRGKILNILRVNHDHDCFKLAGSHKLGKHHLHINVGLGSHPPGRFFCPPTITIYEP